MATTIPGLTITAKSSGDMSSGQYHLVNLSTTNSADGCILGPSTAGGYVVGVWLGNSTAAEHGPVQVSGVSKVQLSSATDAISYGEFLTGSTATIGRAIAITSTAGTQVPIGRALATVSSGSTAIIPFLLGIGHKLDVTA
jgi:hypothetical protein